MVTDFHSLYERYAPAVRRFALFLSGDAAMADDITSETFVRAWTTTGDIREPTVKSYLFTVARNLYRDMMRRERRLSALDDAMPDTRPGLSLRVEHSSELALVFGAMRELSEVDRTVLMMRASEEMTYEEIAQALNLPLATVKVKVYRARLKLMKACRPAANTTGGEPR